MLPSLSLELLSVSESDPELLSESLDELLPLLLLPLLLPLLEGTEALQPACWTEALPAHGAGRKGEESQVSKHKPPPSKLSSTKREGRHRPHICPPSLGT